MRILLVDDERRLTEVLGRALRRDGLSVDVAHNGDQALEKAAVHDYEVVVLDRDLPVVHGDDVCRRLVGAGHASRILMLTASGAVGDRVTGLRLGADDYLAKPFAYVELAARIHALARRPSRADAPVLRRGELTLEPAQRRAHRSGHVLDLAPREFAVMHELMRADGAVVSAEQLLDRAWDEQLDPFSNVARQTLLRLRRKIGEPPLIETVRGGGWRLT